MPTSCMGNGVSCVHTILTSPHLGKQICRVCIQPVPIGASSWVAGLTQNHLVDALAGTECVHHGLFFIRTGLDKQCPMCSPFWDWQIGLQI